MQEARAVAGGRAREKQGRTPSPSAEDNKTLLNPNHKEPRPGDPA